MTVEQASELLLKIPGSPRVIEGNNKNFRFGDKVIIRTSRKTKAQYDNQTAIAIGYRKTSYAIYYTVYLDQAIEFRKDELRIHPDSVSFVEVPSETKQHVNKWCKNLKMIWENDKWVFPSLSQPGKFTVRFGTTPGGLKYIVRETIQFNWVVYNEKRILRMVKPRSGIVKSDFDSWQSSWAYNTFNEYLAFALKDDAKLSTQLNSTLEESADLAGIISI